MHDALTPPPGRLPRPSRPPHARLLDSPDHFPPSPAMVPASNWLSRSAWCLLKDVSLLLRPASAGPPASVAMAAAAAAAVVVVPVVVVVVVVEEIGEYTGVGADVVVAASTVTAAFA